MNIKVLTILGFIFIFSIRVPQTAVADWVNFTGAENAPNIAEIRIGKNHVKLDLEIFIDDLVAFDRLIPTSFFEGTGIDRPPLEARLKQFSAEDFQIIDDKGRHLQARLQLAEPRFRKDRPSPYAGKLNPITKQRIPGPPEDKRVLYVEVIYPFVDKPKTLTFVPPPDEKTGFGKVSLGFITYHKSVLINDFRYLSEPSTITLDWDDPWYSLFDKKVLKRWQRGGVMSFLYVEPFEVRHEILARVKDLSAWMDLGLRGEAFVEADENEALKQKVGEFLLKQDKVMIDGRAVRPILDRTSFVKYTLTRTFFIDQPERLPIETAMVGVIITYLTEGLPQTVTCEWNLWSERIQTVPSDAIDPAGPFPSVVTPESNVLVWTNFLKKYEVPTVARLELDPTMTTMKLPVASVLCLLALLPLALQAINRRKKKKRIGRQAGLMTLLLVGSFLLSPFINVAVVRPALLTSPLDREQAKTVLENLLKNVYRSFDFREEEDVYKRLATSVSGDLLAELYLQNRKSLVVTQAGGARARVKKVEILSVDVDSVKERPLALKFNAQWTAMGTVGHWGHIHTRKNQYHANIIVEPMDGAWKITRLELLDEKRIDPYADSNRR